MNRKQRKQRARQRKTVGAGDSPQKQHGDKFETQIPRGSDARRDEAIRSSQRAQRSEVHQTTDDASTSPASGARTPKTGPDAPRGRTRRPAPDRDVTREIGGGPGAADASSGGGAGAGIPGGGTDMRTGGQIRQGDVDEDRERLFPDSQGNRDESDFGGPARIETDDQGNLKD